MKEDKLKIDKDVAMNILNSNLKEKYEMFVAICDDEKVVNLVKNGVNVKFRIEDVIDGEPFIYLKPKQRIVIINDKVIKLNDFRDEMEERKKIMNRIILESIEYEPELEPLETKSENLIKPKEVL